MQLSVNVAGVLEKEKELVRTNVPQIPIRKKAPHLVCRVKDLSLSGALIKANISSLSLEP